MDIILWMYTKDLKRPAVADHFVLRLVKICFFFVFFSTPVLGVFQTTNQSRTQIKAAHTIKYLLLAAPTNKIMIFIKQGLKNL